ncbi:transporter substrate-binding domain-containing protein [Cutibacterium sp. WCA-380-WT-3A]|uniref:Transporter substrate-binding domain-containing protein n=1 Tax=Cutibacterium porci TaxID=2605781 RepID=A0A7K0J6R6_9ACTN|nr:ABC transporter substrate-binding protein [Cutibacterium porci]MSS45448.1 transporter substrate-binding domain-containing protein [Cutibacterium porci]
MTDQNSEQPVSSSDSSDSAVLPSGATIKADSDSAKPGSATVSRRALLAGIGVSAVAGLAVGAGVAAPIAYHRGKSAAGTGAGEKRHINLVFGGDVCDAPAIVAKEKGFFADAGLDVSLHRTVGDEDIKAAVGSGQYDAASGIFYSWLKPVEQGQNVKFVAGLHGGCLRLVVLKNSKFTKIDNLKGATIGVPSMHSSATMFFSMDLLDAGINPLPEAKQVTWKVMDNSVLGDALKRGQVDAIATSDPIAYWPIHDGSAVELANNMSGKKAQDFCCCTAINGDIIKNEPDVARRLVETWCKGSRYVNGHEAEVAKIEVDGKYVATGDAKLVETFLKNYSWKPSVTKLKSSLLPGIIKFKKTGYLDSSDDPKKLADTAFTTLGFTW